MGEALETAAGFGMNLSAGTYEILLFKILQTSKSRKEMSGEIYEAVEEMVSSIPWVNSFQRGVDGWAFLLTAENERQMQEKENRFVERLKILMEACEGVEYFGGIGIPVPRLRELPCSFRESDRAFSGRFTHAPNQILSVSAIQASHEPDDFRVEKFGEIERTRESVEKFLNNGTQEEIDSFVDAYIGEMSAETFKSSLMRQYTIMDVYIVIMSFCEKMHLSDSHLKGSAEDLKNAIQKIRTLDEIQGYMKELLSQAIEIRDTVSGRRYSDIIEQAKERIEKTYMSEEISLNAIAASVGMSPSYFSSVFSREVGKTFVEFLTGIRMEKAKELLMCSPMKTSEIGYEVGYKDPHYFSYIFKKTQGISPKEYRGRKGD